MVEMSEEAQAMEFIIWISIIKLLQKLQLLQPCLLPVSREIAVTIMVLHTVCNANWKPLESQINIKQTFRYFNSNPKFIH